MQRNKLARQPTPSPSPTEGQAAAVAKVVDNVDLLMLILLRLGFPTSRVRAALVCRRWYGVASDPDFLRRFRQLHPPRLLGFYSNIDLSRRPKFVPLAEASELATAVRCASSLEIKCCDGPGAAPCQAPEFSMLDCRNDGRLLVRCYDHPESGWLLLRPLHPTRSAAVVPPPPLSDSNCTPWFFLPEDGSQEGIIVMEAFLHKPRFLAKVSTFQSGVWTVRTTKTNKLQFPDPERMHSIKSVLPPVRGKIYMSMHLKSGTEELHGPVFLPHLGVRNRVVPLTMVWPPMFPALY